MVDYRILSQVRAYPPFTQTPLSAEMPNPVRSQEL